MKNLFFGLVLGVVAGLAGFFIFTPKMEEKAFLQGYEKGAAEGMVKGIEQGKAEQKRLADSLGVAAKKKIDDAPRKVVKPRVRIEEKNPNDINYTVQGNQVVEERK